MSRRSGGGPFVRPLMAPPLKEGAHRIQTLAASRLWKKIELPWCSNSNLDGAPSKPQRRRLAVRNFNDIFPCHIPDHGLVVQREGGPAPPAEAPRRRRRGRRRGRRGRGRREAQCQLQLTGVAERMRVAVRRAGECETVLVTLF